MRHDEPIRIELTSIFVRGLSDERNEEEFFNSFFLFQICLEVYGVRSYSFCTESNLAILILDWLILTTNQIPGKC